MPMKTNHSPAVLLLTLSIIGLSACSGEGLTYTPHSEGAPTMEWHVGQGTPQEEHVHEGIETTDGGFIAIGQAGEASGQGTDMLIIKVDSEGALEWQQQLGTEGKSDLGVAVIELSNGDFLAGGGLFNDGEQQRALVRLDASGEVEWSKTYTHTGVGAVRGLTLADNGSIIATGYVDAGEEGFLFIATEGEGFLMQVDAQGVLEWDESLSAPQGTKVHSLATGGYRVLSSGWTDVDGEDKMTSMVLDTDASGRENNFQAYESEGMNQAFDFDQTDDGGAILAGHTTGYGAANWDCLLQRIDAEGELVWAKTFGQPRGYSASYVHDECYGVRVLDDGGFVMTGGSGDEYLYSAEGHPSGPSDEWKVYLIRTDSDGELEWQNVYGDGADSGNNAGEFMTLTSDGGFMVFTDTDSAGEAAPNNFGFMKFAVE